MSEAAGTTGAATGVRTAHPAALAVVCGVLFLTFLDTTIVSVTLASVQGDLHAGVTSLQWVVNGYTLSFAALMLAAGALGDRLGHRKVMLGGMVVFCAGSLVAALAGSPAELVVGRVVMGVGAAGSEPATLAFVRHLYPDRVRRARAIGTWAAVTGLAMALGPVIGGLLVGQWQWSAVFWFNLVLGAVLLGLVVLVVPETTELRQARFDVAGFVLSALCLFCAVYGVISGETAGFGAWWVVALFVVSGLALAGFAFAETRVANPILDLAYLRVPMVRSALVVAFAVYFSIFSIFFFTALYLQEVLSYSSWKVAGLFAPMAVTLIGAALVTGRWLGHARARAPMVLGCLVGAVAIMLVRQLLDADPPFVGLTLALALAGVGFGLAVVPLTAVVLASAPADHAGMAAAVTNTVRQVGAVVGVAALGALVNAHLTSDLTHRLNALGVPSGLQGIITSAIEEGDVPTNGAPTQTGTYGDIVQKVISATFGAFRAGLHEALLVSAVLMLAAAAYTGWTTRGLPSGSAGPTVARGPAGGYPPG